MTTLNASPQQVQQSKVHHLDTLRCCAICRQLKPRRQMLRFYKSTQSAHKDKGWQLDEHHLAKLHRHHHPKANHPKANQPQGRGIWLCWDAACHHPKKLGRGFKREADKIAKILTNLQYTQRAR